MPNDYLSRAQAIASRQDRYLTSVVSGFQESLAPIVSRAQGQVVAAVTESLRRTPEGLIDPTPGNLAVLRRLDSTFQQALDESGYPELVEAFVQQFDGQLPFFQETIQALSETMRTPLPAVEWSARDIRAFSGLRLGAVANLDAAVESVGNVAMRNALFSVGGLPFRDLVDLLSTTLGRTVQECATIGSTAMVTYYRTVADRGFKIIEEDLPEVEIRYTYVGPVDNLMRPFCRRMMAQARAGRSWTREQIAVMNNGTSLSNVMVNGGGWGCRHQWAVAAQKLKDQGSPSSAAAERETRRQLKKDLNAAVA